MQGRNNRAAHGFEASSSWRRSYPTYALLVEPQAFYWRPGKSFSVSGRYHTNVRSDEMGKVDGGDVIAVRTLRMFKCRKSR